MTVVTVAGPLIERDGLCQVRERDPRHWWRWQTRSWQTRAADVYRQQPGGIELNWNHTPAPVGKLLALRRSPRGDLWAAGQAQLDEPYLQGDLYYSAETLRNTDGVWIVGVALTRRPATVGLQRLLVLPGGIDQRSRWVVDGFARDLVEQAIEHRHQPGEWLPVRDAADEKLLGRRVGVEHYELLEDQLWQHRPLEYRPSVITRVS